MVAKSECSCVRVFRKLLSLYLSRSLFLYECVSSTFFFGQLSRVVENFEDLRNVAYGHLVGETATP